MSSSTSLIFKLNVAKTTFHVINTLDFVFRVCYLLFCDQPDLDATTGMNMVL